MARKRILLAKMGLDCHDTGIITVAAMQRDAGHEVIYLGLHNNAEQVVKTMIEEHVDAVGISFELFEEMKARIKEDDQSVPYLFNGYYYITRFEKGKDYPIYSRKKASLEAPE